MFLKILAFAVPIAGGGMFFAGGFDAADGGTATASRAAARAGESGPADCDEIARQAIARLDAIQASRGTPEAASADSRIQAWTAELQAEARAAGCSEQTGARVFREALRRLDGPAPGPMGGPMGGPMDGHAEAAASAMEEAAADVDATEIRPGEPMIDVSR
jgi:hypothetical protein